ncbi:hypothetical protein NQ318_005131 [Aromia moschata]|uniref:Cilia- and flagella-associated protein 263 n=1 Tax=Aromia moschata TaxID=1265417 RepID=A0AAV8XU29_9CUCU|nr:hypothetical protein NQ318_005131 [Aromia moschata]
MSNNSLSLESPSLWKWSIDERNSLDDLSDQQLVDRVMERDAECRRIKLENQIFMDFLRANDPTTLELLDTLLKYLESGKGQEQKQAKRFSALPIATLSSHSAEAQKINLTYKTDMVVRAMEDAQTSLVDFKLTAKKIRGKLNAELEEFALRESDIKEARDIFETSVVTLGFDPLTQRIPAEKFIRYMDEWIKSAQMSIQKIKAQNHLLETALHENFAQLKIENKYFREQIDEKSAYLVDLKTVNGGASLVLTNYRKHLQKQEQDHHRLKETIQEKRRLIVETEEECKKKKTELDKSWENYDRIKILKNTYKVPDVIEYVQLKNKLYYLSKNIKVWQRRKKIQDITLNACLRQMKNITGSSRTNPAWLEEVTVEERNIESEDSDEY